MPRKGPAPKRPLVVDPVYASPLVTQLVNKVLLDGKKSTAERIVYGALEATREKTGTDPVLTLKKALGRRLAAIRSSSSSVRWTTSAPRWRSRAAASVAPPTRCRSRSSPVAPRPWPCAGWSATRVSGARRR